MASVPNANRYRDPQLGDRIKTVDGSGALNGRYGTIVRPCNSNGKYGLYLDPYGDLAGQEVQLPQYAFWRIINSENVEKQTRNYPQNAQVVPLNNVTRGHHTVQPIPVNTTPVIAQPQPICSVVPVNDVSNDPNRPPTAIVIRKEENDTTKNNQPSPKSNSSSIVVDQRDNDGGCGCCTPKCCYITWAVIFAIIAIVCGVGVFLTFGILFWLYIPLVICGILSCVFCCLSCGCCCKKQDQTISITT